MTFEAILKELKNKKYAPIYLLHGEESYYIDQISNYIEQHALTEAEKAFNQAILYGKDTEFKQVVDEARQFPMMAKHRVIMLKEAQNMRSLTKLETYAANPSPQSILVICHKHKKIDKRKKLAKAVQKNGILYEAKKIYDHQVPKWINAYLQGKKTNIDFQASQLIADYLGTNLAKVANELDKLIISLKENQTVTMELVQEQIGISKEYNVFELQKAIGQRNSEKVFRILNYFGENPKANPITVVISNLYTYFSKLYITCFHLNSPDHQLQKLLSLPTPYFVKEYKTAARNLGFQRIKSSFYYLKKADLASKGYGLRNNDPAAILQEFSIAILY